MYVKTQNLSKLNYRSLPFLRISIIIFVI